MNRDQIREEVEDVIGRAQDAASDVFRSARSRVRSQAERVAQRATHSAEDVADRVQEAAHDAMRSARSRVKKQARRAAHRTEDAYGAALESLEDAARDRPLQALAVALIVGFIAGLWAVRR